MPDLKWLDRYSGQTVDELLRLEGGYRVDSLVVAFEQGLDQKSTREGDGALSAEERIILAIEALEREVNNGGYRQFFLNSSCEFAPMIVDALMRIGCPRTAQVTQRAIDALHLSTLSPEAIDAALGGENVEDELNECDALYYQAGEGIAGHLFAFIKASRAKIRL